MIFRIKISNLNRINIYISQCNFRPTICFSVPWFIYVLRKENQISPTVKYHHFIVTDKNAFAGKSIVYTIIIGCSAVENINVAVFDPPINSSVFSNTCLLDSALFTNTSLSPSMGTIASWSWNFGDGSALNTTIWSPSHLYASPGNYPITLITYSTNLGCPDTLQDTITVFPMPVANFGFADVCLNQAMNFIDLSVVSIGSITSISWDFGNGTPLSTGPNPTYAYANPGTYTVSLIVSTNNGCKDTIANSVVVHPLPVALYSSSNVCDGSIVSFNDLSTIPNTDNLQSWAWTFGDGSAVDTNQNTSHLYSTNGSYSVQLLIVSNFGCLDSITKISIVNPNPVVSFCQMIHPGATPCVLVFKTHPLLLQARMCKDCGALVMGVPQAIPIIVTPTPLFFHLIFLALH